MKNAITFVVAAVAASFVNMPTAVAQESTGVSRTMPQAMKSETRSDFAPSFGIRTGIAEQNNGYDAAWAWGAEVAFQPFIPLGVGIELAGFSADNGAQPGLTRTYVLHKAMYNFGGTIPVIRHSYVGAGIGPVWDNEANEDIFTTAVAPLLGFDIPIAGNTANTRKFTVGANGSYLFVSDSQPDTLAVNGTAKYWF